MRQLYLTKIKIIVHDENIIFHSAFPAYLTSPTSSLSHLLLFFIIIIVMKEKKTPLTHTHSSCRTTTFFFNHHQKPSSPTSLQLIILQAHHQLTGGPNGPASIHIFPSSFPPPKKIISLTRQVQFEPGRRGANAPRWTGIIHMKTVFIDKKQRK